MNVIEKPDIPYDDGPDADPKKHRLDLYLPETRDPFPILLWIHGGGWTFGDRKLYLELGRRFAERGVGGAVISYRLSPKVRHPEHARDCARAFAWLVAHAKEHGGDPGKLFVGGQSAGGHLSALLALNPRYLEEVNIPAGAIQGVIPMSGLYRIQPFHRDPGLATMIRDAFGDDEEACQDASPAHFARNARAPMLVITEADAEGRGEGVPASFFVRESSKSFQLALEAAGFRDATFMDARDRNHITIVTSMMKKGADPARDAIVEFVKQHSKN